MARTPDLKLRTLWRQRIGRQVDSGLTIGQFCAREGLSVATFQSWKRRLRLIDLADSPSPPPDFLPVVVRGLEPTALGPLPIEVELPDGIRLRIPSVNTRLACCLIRAVARARTDPGGSR
jgi:hypothetical protein